MHPERTVQIDFRAPHLVYPFTKQLSDREKALQGGVCIQQSLGFGRDSRFPGAFGALRKEIFVAGFDDISPLLMVCGV